MSFNVKTISVFEKQAKRLIKKYPSLKKELSLLIGQLKDQPKKGVPIGNDCYKIRVAISSKGKGKSGGARVITHAIYKKDTVYLLSVYDKTDVSTISDKEIKELIKIIPK